MVCVTERPAPGFLPVRISRIPVKRRGSPGEAWEYDEEPGGILHVTPSVRLSTTRPDPNDKEKWLEVELFHNGGEWRIPFVRWSAFPDKTDEDSAHPLCRRLNAQFFPEP